MTPEPTDIEVSQDLMDILKSEIDKRVLHKIRPGDLTVKSIQKDYDLTDTVARRILDELNEEGLVDKLWGCSSRGRIVIYRPNPGKLQELQELLPSSQQR